MLRKRIDSGALYNEPGFRSGGRLEGILEVLTGGSKIIFGFLIFKNFISFRKYLGVSLAEGVGFKDFLFWLTPNSKAQDKKDNTYKE